MSKGMGICRPVLRTAMAFGLGMMLTATAGVHAETISIGLIVNGGPVIDITPLAVGGTSQSFGTVDLTLLNAILTANGSAYQFDALGGTSNWSGAASGGTLTLTGTIKILMGATGSLNLAVVESEDGFSSPVGPSGQLTSSSVGNFNDAFPASHTASSGFDALTTPSYTISSTGTDPNGMNGTSSVGIPSFTNPYTLVNNISFNLTPSADSVAVDGFSVTAKAVAVPEPASLVTMAFGLPLPLLGLAWLRRRMA